MHVRSSLADLFGDVNTEVAIETPLYPIQIQLINLHYYTDNKLICIKLYFKNIFKIFHKYL